MDEENREFASELITKYGSDRFYHSCLRTSSIPITIKMYFNLNEHDDLACSKFMEEIGIYTNNFLSNASKVEKIFSRSELQEFEPQEARSHLCRIAFGFCVKWREFGLRSPELPTHVQARMVLGESNEWVEKYAHAIQKMRSNNGRL